MDWFRFARVRAHVVSLVAVVALLAAGCGEDEIVDQAPPKPAAKPSGGAAKSSARGGAAAGSSAVDGEKGGVSLEGLSADDFNKTEDAEPPPPDPEAVEGHVRINDLAAFVKLASPALGDVEPNDAVVALVDHLYGLENFGGFDLDGSAGIFWIKDFDTPALVLATDDPQEVEALVPDGIADRQGNALSISISVTRGAYLNFGEGYIVITGDWKEFPLAGEQIAELMKADAPEGPDGLPVVAHAEFGQAVWSRYERGAERLAAPAGALSMGWTDTRTDLAVLVGTAGDTTLVLGSDGSRHRLEAKVAAATSAGGLATWLGAERVSVAELVERIPKGVVPEPPRSVVFQDVARAPLETTVMPMAMSSVFATVRDDAVGEAEFARSATLGATVHLHGGFLEKERAVALSKIRDREAFETAHDGVAAKLEAAEAIELLEPVEALSAARPFSYAASGTDIVNGVEIVRPEEGELLSVAVHSDDLALDPATTGGSVGWLESVAELVGDDAAPIVLYVADYATSDSEVGDPAIVAVVSTPDGLRIAVDMPQTQLLRLKSRLP